MLAVLLCCCDVEQHVVAPRGQTPPHEAHRRYYASARYALLLRGGSGVDGGQAVGSTPDAYNRTALLDRADQLRKIDHRPTEALALYREILRHEKNNDPDALGGAAAVLITRKNTVAEARSLLEQALRIAPTDARALHALGVAEWSVSGNATSAAAFFSRAIALDPSHARAHCALANMLEAKGAVVQAEHVLQEALVLLPYSADVANDYGSLLAARTGVCVRMPLRYETRDGPASHVFAQRRQSAHSRAGLSLCSTPCLSHRACPHESPPHTPGFLTPPKRAHLGSEPSECEMLFMHAITLDPSCLAARLNHAKMRARRQDWSGTEELLRAAFALQVVGMRVGLRGEGQRANGCGCSHLVCCDRVPVKAVVWSASSVSCA